ncbi:MAG TPA: transglycosylase SLT domain-containing protein, partial [Woeseiaceae bacterium]|nr:transglycosylase SLT domain-containing protein [Woeseiaceae bacterium]
LYQQYYQGLEIAKLDCIALEAEIRAGHHDRIIDRATELWMVGRSQENECDPVFDYLRAQQLLTPESYRERYALAIDARQFALARYLSGPLEPRYRVDATRWLEARDNPSVFLASHASRADDATHRRQLAYAIEQLAYEDPDTAAVAWRNVRDAYAFSDDQVAATSRHLALWSARRHSLLALEGLLDLPPAAIDTEVRRWTARSSLRLRDWRRVIDSISAMPQSEQEAEEWQYWHAQALRNIAQHDHALSILHDLSAHRSYYGFLAADDLGVDYTFGHLSVVEDPAVIAALEANPTLVRARELFLVGQESKGRSEWDAVVDHLGAPEKTQAALLAHRWGWHSRAISSVASAGEYDDLDIRYPLAYEEFFEQSASDTGIAPSWAYSIARSESHFMSDVRSGAGAVGIMQLMPDTGRKTAKEINLPYTGLNTLTNPGSNIRLGTTYLGKMFERFDRNPIVATAAYNAGPIRVASWLPASDDIDARIWIENIPYNETREYVRRVIAGEVIFHWRLTGETRRISGRPLVVEASGLPARIADSD